MKIKKSNRFGTGKKHKCGYCENLIPIYKKYCSRKCYNDKHNIILICKKCNNNFKVPKNKDNQIYCSQKCMLDDKDMNLIREKSKITLFNKYGTINPFEVKGYNNINRVSNSQAIKESWNKKTLEEKTIISSKISKSLTSRTPEQKQKTKEKQQITNLLKYGDKSSLGKNSIFRKQIEKTQKIKFKIELDKWLLENNLELLDEYNGVKDKNGEIIYYNFKHLPTQTTFIDHLACGRLPLYKDYNTFQTSIPEKEIIEYINSFGINTINNTRSIIKGLEIDIYLPEYKIAIEFNGLMWHSELHGKTNKYHLYKTEECEKQGIHLIHIFEDEWKNKQDIIKSKILNLINKTPNKIYARKCTINLISFKDSNIFLNNNHIQGECKSKINLGLYYNNRLVSVMTFGSLRKITGNISKENEYELLRYSSLLNTNVVGGFSKLLKYFINHYNPYKILSYADRRFSQGKLYESNNFKFISNTPPNYWYMKYHNKREHRFKYRKSELKNILKNFNPNVSEWENMKINEYDRIWDCGSKKYEMVCK